MKIEKFRSIFIRTKFKKIFFTFQIFLRIKHRSIILLTKRESLRVGNKALRYHDFVLSEASHKMA